MSYLEKLLNGVEVEWSSLGDSTFIEIANSGRTPVKASERIPGNVPYYGANNIQDYVEGYTHEGEYVLIAEDGTQSIENYSIQWATGKFWANNHVHVLRGTDRINSRFIFHYLRTVNFIPFLSGGDRAKLTKAKLVDIPIPVPCPADTEETLDQYFEQLGKQFFELYRILQVSQPIRFALSAQQQEQFNSFFSQVQKEYSNLFGLDIVASVRRLGLITFRIAMILTSLRIIDGGQISNLIVCDDSDFQSAIIMARVLLQHTAKVFGSLPPTERTANGNTPTIIKQTFLDNLPPEFDRKTYLAVAEKLKIPHKTAEKYISRFCVGGQLKHLAHDSYGKP